jgi:hypothetical protein
MNAPTETTNINADDTPQPFTRKEVTKILTEAVTLGFAVAKIGELFTKRADNDNLAAALTCEQWGALGIAVESMGKTLAYGGLGELYFQYASDDARASR